ncbi:hypothetical protein [Photorhabdus tasmaniensis]|uniref:Adhesin n=1 Tax=Photorhabdus tasmaniensis TaxID=1004159 RepID=A0ABX0GNL7_9GAMM|nr:hypothetical protein [Photorhabdus tasmaniensis]NHB90466.1 hypothetical protein [Photorhabdus tasmaniensis]
MECVVVENNYLTAKQIPSWLEKFRAASTEEERNRLIEVAGKADQTQQQKAIETRITKEYLVQQQEELIKLVQSPGCDADCIKLAEHSLKQLSPVIDSYEVLQNGNNVPRAVVATTAIAAPWASRAVAPLFADGVGSMMLTTGTIGAGANAGIQYLTTGEINPVDVGFAFGTGAFTAYTGFWGTVGWNAGMGGAASAVKGDDPYSIGLNILSAGTGAGAGYGVGKLTTFTGNKIGQWQTSEFNPKFNPKLQGGAVKGEYGLSKDMKPHPLPGILGNMGAAGMTEGTNWMIQEEIKKAKEKANENKK